MTTAEPTVPDPEKQVPSDINTASAAAAEDDGHDRPVSKYDGIADETGALAASALGSAPLDEAQSRAVLRKLDRRILPFLCVTYALQFIDKTSLGYSSVYGIIPDNGLVAQQYGWASSVFYFGYLAAEWPGVAALQRLPVARFLGANVAVWGAVLAATAACSSFAGLASVRFLLGAAEATVSPGFVAVTGMWWTRREQAGRSALWVSFLGVGSFAGTLLAYGIGHVRGGPFAPWRYIFLVLGAATVVWGVVFALFVPDGPARAGWLTERERVVAVQRVAENKAGTGRSRTFVAAQVLEAARDPAVVVLGLISFVNAIASGGLAFGSLVIQGFGFSPLQTTLMNLPLSAVQVVAQLGAGFLTSRIPGSRLHVATAAMVPPIIGTLLINQLHPDNKWGRLAGVWLLGSYPVGFMVVLGLLSTNVAGGTKRSVASGWVFVCYCVGQIAGPQFFKSTEAPAYRNGVVAMLCSFVLNLVLNQVLRLVYAAENRRRDGLLEGKSEGEIADMQREGEVLGFQDVTDKVNPMFRYVL
ncbi:MFS general substrate transporter [Colletotrichum caudatum]|nr:MFS general substrate transporter [Colletotrichum caudatum]